MFYDLGSGTGKALIAAALLCPFSKIRGIELLPNLYKTSLEVKDQYETLLKDKYNDAIHPGIEIENKNIEKTDFSDADLVLINSTCFDMELVDLISQSEGLKGDRILLVLLKN